MRMFTAASVGLVVLLVSAAAAVPVVDSTTQVGRFYQALQTATLISSNSQSAPLPADISLPALTLPLCCLTSQASSRRLLAQHAKHRTTTSTASSAATCCSKLPAGFNSTLPVVIVDLRVSVLAPIHC